MDKSILSLHPITDGAWHVLKDSRNANLVMQVSEEHDQDAASPGESLALSLTTDRAPKAGSKFTIGRHADADIVLTDPEASARHCLTSFDAQGIAVLHEQSTNGTYINEEKCQDQTFEVKNGMQIRIQDVAFEIRVPWRGTSQKDYEYNAKRARETRALTPFEISSPRLNNYTALVQMLGSYTLTNSCIDSFKVNNTELWRTDIVSKKGCLFAAKRFSAEGAAWRELQVWKKVMERKHIILSSSIHVANADDRSQT